MGGNVFGTTAPIKRIYIKPTLLEFFKQLKQVFPEAERHFRDTRLLGSAGKKEYSGDIDLALDEKAFVNLKDWGLDKKHVQELFDNFKKRARTASDSQLLRRAVLVCIAEKIDQADVHIEPDVKGTGSGALFMRFPQFNEKGKMLKNLGVQIDLNVGNLEWLTFSYYSGSYSGNVKGLHRTQLMLSLFSTKGFTFSHNYGIKNKESQEIVATTPTEAVDLLNRVYGTSLTSDVLSDYHKLMKHIRENLPVENLYSVFDTYLRILDSTRADIPDDLQSYWLDNQDRLGLTGKYLPSDSKLNPFKN